MVFLCPNRHRHTVIKIYVLFDSKQKKRWKTLSAVWQSPTTRLRPKKTGSATAHINYNYTWQPVLWIQILIRSVFRNFVDPDPYSEYGIHTGENGINKRQKVLMTKIHHSDTQQLIDNITLDPDTNFMYLDPQHWWQLIARLRIRALPVFGSFATFIFLVLPLMDSSKASWISSVVDPSTPLAKVNSSSTSLKCSCSRALRSWPIKKSRLSIKTE